MQPREESFLSGYQSKLHPLLTSYPSPPPTPAPSPSLAAPAALLFSGCLMHTCLPPWSWIKRRKREKRETVAERKTRCWTDRQGCSAPGGDVNQGGHTSSLTRRIPRFLSFVLFVRIYFISTEAFLFLSIRRESKVVNHRDHRSDRPFPLMGRRRALLTWNGVSSGLPVASRSAELKLEVVRRGVSSAMLVCLPPRFASARPAAFPHTGCNGSEQACAIGRLDTFSLRGQPGCLHPPLLKGFCLH